jgi:hypothetical protein
MGKFLKADHRNGFYRMERIRKMMVIFAILPYHSYPPHLVKLTG